MAKVIPIGRGREIRLAKHCKRLAADPVAFVEFAFGRELICPAQREFVSRLPTGVWSARRPIDPR